MNINLSLDQDRVQSSVQAAIRPAVEKALAGKDIEKAIHKALTTPLSRSHSIFDVLHGRDKNNPTALIDDMIEQGVREIAQQFVRSKLMDHKAEILSALEDSMKDSGNILAKAFASATAKALEGTWEFDFSVGVAAKEKERADDY